MSKTGWMRCGVVLAAFFVLTAQRALDSPPLKRVRLRGAELSYVEQGRGQPVVLIHGALLDYRSWSLVWPGLSKRYRVIAYSQRYNYPNPTPADGSQLSVATGAADLAALVESLGLAPVHLVGHSRGANLALMVARDRPALVRSMVLGEAGVPAITALSPEARSLPQDTGQALDAFKRGDIEGAARSIFESVIGTKDAYDQAPLEQRRPVLENIPREFGAQLAASASAASPPQFTCSDARQINVPTLMVMGERTARRFRLATEELRKCMPQSDHSVLPQATHALQMENPARFNAIVLEFLARHSGSPGR